MSDLSRSHFAEWHWMWGTTITTSWTPKASFLRIARLVPPKPWPGGTAREYRAARRAWRRNIKQLRKAAR